MGVPVSLHCPFCGSDAVTKNGHSNGKQRSACHNIACSHKTFYAEYTYVWFGTREHTNLDALKQLLSPLNIGTVDTDGNYAYFERFASAVLVVSKKNTQKIERKHWSLRTWCCRLVRKGIRFSKTAQMHKIVVGLTINVRFFGDYHLVQ